VYHGDAREGVFGGPRGLEKETKDMKKRVF
jgi:hypothetical protein